MITIQQVVLAVLATALLCGADMTLAGSVAKRSAADGEYLLSIFLNKMSQVWFGRSGNSIFICLCPHTTLCSVSKFEFSPALIASHSSQSYDHSLGRSLSIMAQMTTCSAGRNATIRNTAFSTLSAILAARKWTDYSAFCSLNDCTLYCSSLDLCIHSGEVVCFHPQCRAFICSRIRMRSLSAVPNKQFEDHILAKFFQPLCECWTSWCIVLRSFQIPLFLFLFTPVGSVCQEAFRASNGC